MGTFAQNGQKVPRVAKPQKNSTFNFLGHGHKTFIQPRARSCSIAAFYLWDQYDQVDADGDDDDEIMECHHDTGDNCIFPALLQGGMIVSS